jgi:hypothetical protein
MEIKGEANNKEGTIQQQWQMMRQVISPNDNKRKRKQGKKTNVQPQKKMKEPLRSPHKIERARFNNEPVEAYRQF